MYIVICKTGRFEYYKTSSELARRLFTLHELGYDLESDVKVVSNPMYPDKGDMTGAQFLTAIG